MSAVEAKTIGESAEQAEVDLTLDNISIVPDSLCMARGGVGETRIMLTKIPYSAKFYYRASRAPTAASATRRSNSGRDATERVSHGRDVFESGRSRSAGRQERVVQGPRPGPGVGDSRGDAAGVVTTVEGVLTRAADELAALQPQSSWPTLK